MGETPKPKGRLGLALAMPVWIAIVYLVLLAADAFKLITLPIELAAKYGPPLAWLGALGIAYLSLWLSGLFTESGLDLRDAFQKLVAGADGRVSTSKIQLLWWVLAAIVGLSAVKIRQIQIGDGTNLEIPTFLLTALGASAVTAVGAGAIAASQAKVSASPPADAVTKVQQDSANEVKPGADPEQGKDIRFAISDDKGDTDITKIQMLAFNALAIFVFLYRVNEQVRGTKIMADQINVDPALLILAGIGGGTYLGRKLIPSNTPWLLSARVSAENGKNMLVLVGRNFGDQRSGIITLNDQPQGLIAEKWETNQIRAEVPNGFNGKVGIISQGESSPTQIQVGVPTPTA